MTVAAECCSATSLDRGEYPQVQPGQPGTMFLDEAFAYRTDNVGHLEGWPIHPFFSLLFRCLTPSAGRFRSLWLATGNWSIAEVFGERSNNPQVAADGSLRIVTTLEFLQHQFA